MGLSASVKRSDGKETRAESDGSARILRLLDKEFALKRAIFFMRIVYPHFRKTNSKKAAVYSGILQKTRHKYTCPISERRLAVLLARASKRLVAYREGIRDIRNAIPILKQAIFKNYD